MNFKYTESELDMIARNAIRLKEAKEKLGTAWLIHPDNFVTKKLPPELKKPKTRTYGNIMELQLKQLLRDGNVLVTFTKADGTERVMTCTSKADVVQSLLGIPNEGAVQKTQPPGLIRVVDVELNAFRSFHFDSIINYTAV